MPALGADPLDLMSSGITPYDLLQQAARRKPLIRLLIVSAVGTDAASRTITAAQNKKPLDNSPVLRVYAVR
jgi:hypothetical protein